MLWILENDGTMQAIPKIVAHGFGKDRKRKLLIVGHRAIHLLLYVRASRRQSVSEFARYFPGLSLLAPGNTPVCKCDKM